MTAKEKILNSIRLRQRNKIAFGDFLDREDEAYIDAFCKGMEEALRIITEEENKNDKNEFRLCMMDIFRYHQKMMAEDTAKWIEDEYREGFCDGLELAMNLLKDAAFLTEEKEV